MAIVAPTAPVMSTLTSIHSTSTPIPSTPKLARRATSDLRLQTGKKWTDAFQVFCESCGFYFISLLFILVLAKLIHEYLWSQIPPQKPLPSKPGDGLPVTVQQPSYLYFQSAAHLWYFSKRSVQVSFRLASPALVTLRRHYCTETAG